MSDKVDLILRTALIGIGATVAMDLWAILLRRAFGVASLDYRLLGRWIGHLPRGRFIHESIGKTKPIRGELMIGWIGHYSIGVTFAALLVAIWGREWTRHPTLLPALLVGLGTILAPFFILQPGLGLGIASSKTPRPNVARLRSLATHTVYGLGLYGAALALSFVKY